MRRKIFNNDVYVERVMLVVSIHIFKVKLKFFINFLNFLCFTVFFFSYVSSESREKNFMIVNVIDVLKLFDTMKLSFSSTFS